MRYLPSTVQERDEYFGCVKHEAVHKTSSMCSRLERLLNDRQWVGQATLPLQIDRLKAQGRRPG